jgi:DNA-binding GntR family transcriptional regulator
MMDTAASAVDLLSERAELPVSFAEHVRTLLENEITEGRLAGGHRVREVELAQMLGVSRTPVREALRTLERDGLVVRTRGRGTVIAPPLEPDEVLTLYSVRLALEPFLAGRAATRLEPAGLDGIVEAQRTFQQIASKSQRRQDDIRNLLAADTKIHMTMYLSSGSVLTNVVESYWARTVRERSFLYSNSERGSLVQFAQAHEQIIEALRKRDPSATRRLVQEHLESGVEVLRRRLLDEGSETS